MLISMYFGVYIEYSSSFYPRIHAIVQGRDVIAVFGAILTPIVTMFIAFFAAKQWQVQNFMHIKDKISEAQGMYIKESQILWEEYSDLPESKKQVDDILELFDGRKKIIISKYLDNLESLALYLHHRVIPEAITKDFFRAALRASLNEELESYIIDAQEREPNFYKTFVALVKKWK